MTSTGLSPESFRVAVIGSGPAGLMSAFVVAKSGCSVELFEKRPSLGRKLLIAGSSGLNITYDCTTSEMAEFFGRDSGRFRLIFSKFSAESWRAFIETELGVKTFKGTSRRWFVDAPDSAGVPQKGAGLLKVWTDRLVALGVQLRPGSELLDFSAKDGQVEISVATQSGEAIERFDAVCLCLGGGSWEPQEKPLKWISIFARKKIAFREFVPSNVGYQVSWPSKLLEEAEGKPIKNVVLRSSRGERAGDLVVTRYGLEGTPVYFAGESGVVRIDLKPDLSLDGILKKLREGKENLSVIRRIDQRAGLSAAAFALVFHMAPRSGDESLESLESTARLLKNFPLTLGDPQPLDEAISSRGGLEWSEIDDRFMLRQYPGVFVAGEMLDWDAPTGGFLIQGCVSQGYVAGRAIVDFLTSRQK